AGPDVRRRREFAHVRQRPADLRKVVEGVALEGDALVRGRRRAAHPAQLARLGGPSARVALAVEFLCRRFGHGRLLYFGHLPDSARIARMGALSKPPTWLGLSDAWVQSSTAASCTPCASGSLRSRRHCWLAMSARLRCGGVR